MILDAAPIPDEFSAIIEYTFTIPLTANFKATTVIMDNMTNGNAKLISATLPTIVSKLNAICPMVFEAALISFSLLAIIEYMFKIPLIANFKATTAISDNITNGNDKLISEILPIIKSKLEDICLNATAD
jgi:hypothetical protein